MMITSLIVTVVLIVAGCFLLLQMYDMFESEIVRTLIVAAYGLFVVSMLIYWFVDNLDNIMNNII